jgi:hypothetical protein
MPTAILSASGTRRGRVTSRVVRGLVMWLALGAILALLFVPLSRYAFDDAYIHFRIADHLVRYGQPYFNPGEPVMASSSSAWTLTLAALFALAGRDAGVGLVPILNALAVAAGMLIYGGLARQMLPAARPWLVYPLVALAYLNILFFPAVGLMETPLTMLVVGAGLALWLRRSPLALTLFAVAIYFRLEMVVLLAVFGGYALLRRTFTWRQLILHMAVGVLPFALYGLAFFGTIIPQTVIAKALVYSPTPAQTLEAVASHLAVFSPAVSSPWRILTGALVLIAAGVLTARDAPARRGRLSEAERGMLLFTLCGVLVAVAYTVQRVYVVHWYVPLFATPILFGAACALAGRAGRLAPLVAVSLAALFAADVGTSVYAGLATPGRYPLFEINARVNQYIRVGADLYRQYPDAVLLTSEIGGLGYGFEGRIADGAGLVSPAALRYHPMRVPEERSNALIGAIPLAYVLEMNPEIIVSYDINAEQVLRGGLESDYIHLREPIYTPEDMALATHPYMLGSEYLHVFIRRDVYRVDAPDLE